MTQLVLGLTVLALLAGGVAVDVMRHEGTRSRVQKALDACTTNAALTESVGISNSNLTTAVNNCMTSAGLASALNNVAATTTTGLTNVAATASGTQTNQFMQMLSVNSTNYSGASSAVMTSNGVEVVLAYEASNAIRTAALDTSLKAAATTFVDTLMGTDGNYPGGTRPLTSVALLPYSDGVNLPSAVFGRYTISVAANVTGANCIDPPASDFTTSALLTTTSYPALITVDATSTTTRTTFDANGNSTAPYIASNDTSLATPASSSATCPAYAGQVVTVPTNVASTVKTAITASEFFSSPRWDIAMNWASALLHPSSNAALSPSMPASINTRPLAYNTANTQKVIVFINRSGSGSVTSDGSHNRIASAYASGASPIYRNSSVSPATYCINLTARNATAKFFQPAISTTAAWTTSCPAGFTQLTWPQVWASLRVSWVAWQLYARGMQTTGVYPTTAGTAQTTYQTQMNTTYTSMMAAMVQNIPFSTQQTQFESECAAAKANGVVIYTVALSAVTRAVAPLQTCATSSAHYFSATSSTISDVLRTIAQTIRQQEYSQ